MVAIQFEDAVSRLNMTFKLHLANVSLEPNVTLHHCRTRRAANPGRGFQYAKGTVNQLRGVFMLDNESPLLEYEGAKVLQKRAACPV